MGLFIMAICTGDVAFPARRNNHGIAFYLMLFSSMTFLAGKVLAINCHMHIKLT
jgi:hypothetical protein